MFKNIKSGGDFPESQNSGCGFVIYVDRTYIKGANNRHVSLKRFKETALLVSTKGF